MLTLSLLILTCSLASAQKRSYTTSEREVITVIDQLFDAMRRGDSTALRKVFHSTARMQTTFLDKNSREPRLSTQASPDKFIQAVGTPHDEVWNEVVLDYTILIDDQLATVWTPYEFYRGDTFSHCGVNAFHLFKSKEGWKITQITDTRRQEGCKK
ncbi:MAG: nuclear transport factor 2 family protein [Microscillaceae bacterium]|nr:nuclear transport factor 2 family protein [Microscillaceae bacterium]